MFDFTRRVKLAAGDSVRRVVLKAAAGLIGVVGSGFLIAALWSYLAHQLRLGPTLASLVLAVALFVIAGILIALSSRQKHAMPTGEDLSREVQARITTAKDAAVGKVRDKASQLTDTAQSKVVGTLRDAASAVGLSDGTLHEIKDQVRHGRDVIAKSADTNVGSMAKLIGAFAVGITLAAKLQEMRHRDPVYDPDDFI